MIQPRRPSATLALFLILVLCVNARLVELLVRDASSADCQIDRSRREFSNAPVLARSSVAQGLELDLATLPTNLIFEALVDTDNATNDVREANQRIILAFLTNNDVVLDTFGESVRVRRLDF